jgi:hypothetical protein
MEKPLKFGFVPDADGRRDLELRAQDHLGGLRELPPAMSCHMSETASISFLFQA